MRNFTLPLPAGTKVVHSRDLSQPQGHVLRRAYDCEYPPAVRSTDLLHVDFSINDVDAPGLYLVESLDPDLMRVYWRGCRRFDVAPARLLMDQSGTGEWVEIDLAAYRMRIAGMVIDVYRSTRTMTEVRHG